MKVISVVGYHKAGKTTLVERLVKELAKHGRVGTVKHTREEILPLTGDTERHLNAGAEVTIGVTQSRLVKIIKDTGLEAVLGQLLDEGLDFAVVEGFKESGIPKIGIGDVVAKNVVARVDINATGEELARIAMGQPDRVTLEYLIARARRSPHIGEAGAIGAFTGAIREAAGPDGTAGERLKNIEEDLKKREGILDTSIYYGDGGIVNIIVISRRREELFPALKEAVERLGAEAPAGNKGLSGDFRVSDVR